MRCDVTDEDGVAAAVAQADAELGPITNLCNIAGIGGFAHTPEQSLSGWDKIIAVNLTGTFLMCRAVLPGMLEHGGAIVNTVSTAGIIGQPYSAAYCASKGGVRLLTKALAVEYMAAASASTAWPPAASTRRSSTTSARPRMPTGS